MNILVILVIHTTTQNLQNVAFDCVIKHRAASHGYSLPVKSLAFAPRGGELNPQKSNQLNMIGLAATSVSDKLRTNYGQISQIHSALGVIAEQ